MAAPASTLLSKSVENAECVIWYAAEHGIEVDEKLVDTVVKTRDAVRDGRLTADDEVRFWASLDELARIVRPATVEGVAARYLPAQLSASTGAPSLLRHYRIRAYFVFGLLLLFQVQALIGIRAVENSRDLPAKIAAAKAGIELENLKNEAVATETIIRRWNWLNPLWWGMSSPGSGSQVVAPNDDLVGIEALKFYMEALQKFILPLFYGWLGACLFIMRKLGRDFDEMSIANASNVVYAMRQALGSLAGVAIGMFFGPDITVSTRSLSTYAIAFLAGYSVEILFTAMDRLVEAFSDK